MSPYFDILTDLCQIKLQTKDILKSNYSYFEADFKNQELN